MPEEQPDDLGIVDVVKDKMEGLVYSSRAGKKLFGYVGSLKELIANSQGPVTVEPRVNLVAPLSAARYPFQMEVKYTAHALAINPVIGNQLKYIELIRRMKEDEYSRENEESLRKELESLLDNRQKRISVVFSRECVVRDVRV